MRKMDLYKAKYSDKKFDRHSKSNQTSSKYSKDDEPIRSFRNSRDERPSRDKYSRDERPSRDKYSRDERPSRDKYSRDERPSRDKYSRDERKSEMHTVTCSDCGDECQIPFEPKFNRPVYCSECFQKNKPRESRDKYSNDRPSRYNSDDFKTSKSKSEKFLKRSERFYSNGSEKFYSSLKEKLFEILGGKMCSSCGFKDERALGFNHIHDENAFDSIRRGGFASSWGKYISEPELARKDLRVLCLNCNEIREPEAKTEPKKSKTPNKKSRYFPR
jgi:CxxC-x17-CxxC domain-containing protein